MTYPSMGWATRTGIGFGADTAATKEYEFLSNSVRKVAQHVQSDGIRGIRGRQSESVVEGTYGVDGDLVLEPRIDEIEALLELALGGTASAHVVNPADLLPEFLLDVAKGNDSYRYAGCKVNSLTIRSAANQPLQFALSIAGKTEASITFPDIRSTLSAARPFIHHQCVFTIGGTARKVANVELTINNALILDRFFNSQTRTEIPEGDRICTVAADFPNTTDENDLYNIAIAGLGTNSIVWSSGGTSLSLALAKLQAPAEGAQITNRNTEVGRRIAFDIRRATSTAEIVATIDPS